MGFANALIVIFVCDTILVCAAGYLALVDGVGIELVD